ncbi:MAG: DUF2625 domain-containing protein [Bacteroidetes bacterium]|nr:DUF2625 domain-containing protein [Bacteroidota bacterium]
MKPLSSLINTVEPAWTDFLQQWIKEAKNHVEVLPKDKVKADSALYKAQVTTRSPMGAVIYETGGILVDHGWIRILGSGSKKLDRNLMDWNKGKTYSKLGEQLPYLLIADDVLGGFFAINAGGVDKNEIGKVFYFAPDNLTWTTTGLNYTDFLNFCFSGNIKQFYETLYWIGWENDIKLIDGNMGYSCFPYLYTVEGRDINKVSRKAVSIQELWDLNRK